MYALTPFVFIRGVIAPKWFAPACPKMVCTRDLFAPFSCLKQLPPSRLAGLSDRPVAHHSTTIEIEQYLETIPKILQNKFIKQNFASLMFDMSSTNRPLSFDHIQSVNNLKKAHIYMYYARS